MSLRQFKPVSLSAAVLGACLALAGFNASADAGYRVRSETSAVAITVIDLTPNDGRAAGFNKEPVDNSMSIWFSNRDHFLDAVGSPGTAPSDAVSLQNGPSLATRSYGPGVGQFSSDTAVSIARQGTPVSLSQGETRQTFSLEILPFTEVHLTGTYMLSVERTGSELVSVAGIVNSGMSINQWSFDSNGIPTNTFRDEYYASIDLENSSGNESKSGQFDLVYRNYGSGTQMIHYFAYTSDEVRMGQFEPGIPPVPEPETYAMLGLGLLVLGATARRRQRRTALQAQGGREPG